MLLEHVVLQKAYPPLMLAAHQRPHQWPVKRLHSLRERMRNYAFFSTARAKEVKDLTRTLKDGRAIWRLFGG